MSDKFFEDHMKQREKTIRDWVKEHGSLQLKMALFRDVTRYYVPYCIERAAKEYPGCVPRVDERERTWEALDPPMRVVLTAGIYKMEREKALGRKIRITILWATRWPWKVVDGEVIHSNEPSWVIAIHDDNYPYALVKKVK